MPPSRGRAVGYRPKAAGLEEKKSLPPKLVVAIVGQEGVDRATQPLSAAQSSHPSSVGCQMRDASSDERTGRDSGAATVDTTIASHHDKGVLRQLVISDHRSRPFGLNSERQRD